MFIVLLEFSDNRNKAADFMEDHKAWLQNGFDDDIFILAGSLQPSAGGGILAQNTSLSALKERVDQDPFVVQNVVNAEIIEITPSRADERLKFLLN